MKNFGMIRQFGSTLFLSLALALGLAMAQDQDQENGVADPETGAQAGDNVTQFLEDRGEFQTLLSGFETAGLTQTIQDDRAVTVIAPRDQAFEQTAEGAEGWTQDTQRLTDLANVHVLEGSYTLEDLRNMSTVTTIQGQELQVETTAEGDVSIAGVRLTESDFRTGDDVVHVADSFISPDQVMPAVGGDAPEGEGMDQPEDAETPGQEDGVDAPDTEDGVDTPDTEDGLDDTQDGLGDDTEDGLGDDTDDGLGNDLDDTNGDEEQTP